MKICECGDTGEAIKYATAVSAIVVTRQGAQSSIPTKDEIEEFIKKN
jgi:ribokinase